jgi:hypothetical protein
LRLKILGCDIFSVSDLRKDGTHLISAVKRSLV